MKINKEVESLIFGVADTAQSVGITEFAIDVDGVRGIDSSTKSVVILKETMDIDLPFQSIAVGDIATFVQRYNIHKSNAAADIIMEVNDGDEVISTTFKSKNLKIDFRCIKSSRVDAPRKMKQREYYGSFEVNDEVLSMIKKGSISMKADNILFVKDEKAENVYFQMDDINNSAFKYEIEDGFIPEVDPCMFAMRFPVKLLLAALKDADENILYIGINQTVTVFKNGIEIIIPASQ